MFDPKKRKTGVVLVECVMSLPNGDPDRENQPRMLPDAENPDGFFDDGPIQGRVFMTNSSINRKVRDTAKQFHGVKLYVDHGNILSEVQAKLKSVAAILGEFWDCRQFGATLTQFNSEGRLTGPLIFGPAVSVAKARILKVALTRVAGEKQKEKKNKDTEAGDDTEAETGLRANMGSKFVVQHAVFKIPVYFSPANAARTKLTEEDMRICWDSVMTCWNHSKATGRSDMRFRRLVVFEHDDVRGCEHDHVTVDRVGVTPKVAEPQSWEDYTVSVSKERLNSRIEVFDLDDSTFGLPAK